MKFRRKHSEQSEVFTDSLNDILFILLMFFLIVATLANPNVIRVGLPKGAKDTKAKQHIMVSIDRNQQFYLGTIALSSDRFEEALTNEIRRFRSLVDTPTVVINADTTAYYGEVYQIMLLAKKERAKVVARIE
jgi:biopolymer transport protein ExbD